MIKITTELDSVKRVIDVITKTAPPPSGNVTFECRDGRVKVISVADLSRCEIIMAGSLEGEGEFAIPLSSFKDATTGREKINIEYHESALVIASGRYRTTLSTVDVVPADDVSIEEGAQQWKLSAEQATWLKETLKKVALKPTTLFSSWMPAGIQLTSKGAFVSCYDDQHLSWVRDKKMTGDFTCLLPIDVLQSVMDIFHATKFRITQSKAFIQVTNGHITLLLNTPSSDDVRPVSEVFEKVKAASAAEGIKFSMPRAKIQEYLTNARAVVGKERAEIEITPIKKDAGMALFEIKTVQGNSEAKLKFKGKITSPFRVDHDYFSELVSKCGDEVEVSVVEGAFLSIPLKDTTALVALNQ